MNRRQIYLTDYEVEEIKKYAFELGTSMSEYIRRVIDDHLEKKKKKVATAGI